MNIFQEEYKIAINNIIKDIYQNTPYWGRGSRGSEGVIKPITEDDDPNWSNFNFINTHYTVREEVVEPFIRQKGFNKDIELSSSYKDSEVNREYFRLLWLNRYELFGPESRYAPEIIEHINITRGKGDKRETLTGKILNGLPFLDVDIRGSAGSFEDFMGTDAIINYKGRDYTAQIKPFTSYQVNNDKYYIQTRASRKYDQDLMIFTKKSDNEYHILIFWNRGYEIDQNENLYFSKDDFFLAVNYNIDNKKLRYKLNS